ncbi:hypothetical protein [Streptomyces azureus]|uniref:Uncharacterized protein n=1 Tax=Streptomyces azureus TaxID=146537 RepID=A0A0K8PQV1_STRAJ|nr:hypothetical protein [Streptomyces azureus]GAP50231.1 uncharacterized protein SAZU_5087 [Streptomyces azureus]
MAADFQTGEIPHGFAFDERGELIHYKYGIVLAVPSANQAGWSGDMWLSFGSAWRDAKIKVNWHDGTNWSAAVDLTVTHAGGRVHTGAKLPTGTQKIAIGRVKKTLTDTEDDIPVSWLLQVAEA